MRPRRRPVGRPRAGGLVAIFVFRHALRFEGEHMGSFKGPRSPPVIGACLHALLVAC